ncbi:MAG: transcription antitermination factor NusB [Ignavibacteria bacterium]|nr:transcription antitermination factor NusB [Ignavibacteria bacterium]
MATYKRRLAREKVLQTLYAYEISREPIIGVMDQLLAELKDDKESFDFAKKLIHEVIQHQDEIEGRIRQRVSHWEFDRIAVIDRILLRMGICELEYFPDIPPKVTINELIEVAKTFSTENSGRFVNGVLDAILEDLRKSNTLKKTGRGLIDQNLTTEEKRTGRVKPPKTT